MGNLNPQDPASFNHQTAQLLSGRKYHYVDEKPANYDATHTPVLLLVHGFPDFWYGWRNQIGPWVQKGYRVVVPDMLGYGQTDKPTQSDEYSTRRLCADLAALMDHLSVSKFVCIGHDWGSFVVGRFALWHPHRLLGLVQISVPYTPPTPEYRSIQEVAKAAPNLSYQVYFNSEEAVTDIQENLPQFLNMIFRRSHPGQRIISFDFKKPVELNKELVLSDEEMNIYQQTFSSGGIRGPLNYYRTNKIRYEEELEAELPSSMRDDLPVLLLWGKYDSTVVVPAVEKSHKFIPRLRSIALEGKGHWLMLEASDEVTKLVGDFLDEMVPAKGSAKL